eukprot:TRINITY_DN11309_c0_g1_i1.p1 TRINITY_DN11309_c0_g1~~TRINITY_DN11309_c0_g1_i1.p1  ORF type:complete len:423 (+),score=85.48 TRINITY_DN11309_c0_g1_i1:29-1270(+)
MEEDSSDLERDIEVLREDEVSLSSSEEERVGGEEPRFAPGAGDSSRVFEKVEVEEHATIITDIMVPVCITMVLVIWVVKSINLRLQSSLSAALVYQENSSDSVGTKLGGSLLNALIMVAMILGVTAIFVVCYKYRCLKFIYGWLFLSTGTMLAAIGGYLFYEVLSNFNIPMDYITFSILIWNFAVVGIISVFWYAPLKVNQMYLICISAFMAILLTKLPEWSTWTILSAIAVYDLFAVLCPGGPLRVLVETAQERSESIPALIYSASIWMMMASSSSSSLGNSSSVEDENNNITSSESHDSEDDIQLDDLARTADVDEESDEPQGSGVKLGLGDFVFYSVLVGRAAMFDMLTVFTSFIGIVAGLFCTILLLALWKKALPALPISIFFGIVFYVLTRVALLPFTNDMLLSGIVV